MCTSLLLVYSFLFLTLATVEATKNGKFFPMFLAAKLKTNFKYTIWNKTRCTSTIQNHTAVGNCIYFAIKVDPSTLYIFGKA